MHLFLPYLLNDSQTVHFSKPLLCVTLICCDWSHYHLVSPVILIKQCLWAQCCFALPGKPICVLLQKRHLVAKNEFAFSFRPTWKDQQVGGNMLMFHADINADAASSGISNGSILSSLYSMHPRYQEHIRELSCVLCTCVLENWNWTSTVNDDLEREHKEERIFRNSQ